MWAALTCCSAVNRQEDTTGGCGARNTLCKVAALEPQREAIFAAAAATGLEPPQTLVDCHLAPAVSGGTVH